MKVIGAENSWRPIDPTVIVCPTFKSLRELEEFVAHVVTQQKVKKMLENPPFTLLLDASSSVLMKLKSLKDEDLPYLVLILERNLFSSEEYFSHTGYPGDAGRVEKECRYWYGTRWYKSNISATRTISRVIKSYPLYKAYIHSSCSLDLREVLTMRERG